MTKYPPIREHFTEAQIQQLKDMGIEVEALEYLRSWAESVARQITDSFGEYADTSDEIAAKEDGGVNGDS